MTLVLHGPLAADAISPIAPRCDHCAACKGAFAVGDYWAEVPVGPGTDPQARAAARERRRYKPATVPVHWACATGQEMLPTENQT